MTIRFRLVGDHADYHAGSAAVTQTLLATLRRQGVVVPDGEDYDALVVNGEGSMHHGSNSFRRKMEALRQAQSEGRRTWLVNSLWQDNPPDYDDVLRRLDGICVRGEVSRRDLLERHGIVAPAYLDFSYFAPVAPASGQGRAGGVVISDIYATDLGGFVWPSAEHFQDMGRIDLRGLEWSELVDQLGRAAVFVTGRHHGMYAACRARTPFVNFPTNSHKFEDLLQTAGFTVPVCRAFRDVARAVAWAANHSADYDRLFDWMEAQTGWPGPSINVQI
jgi:hypothetical protein